MDRLSHFLITRFNVSIPTWNRDKSGIATLDDAWMDHRMTLFNRYCVPTVRGQTETHFRWLIYCDTNTAARYIEKIKASISQIPHAEIRFVADFTLLKKDLKQVLAASESSYVITSRVDNDDGLGKEYIETTQKYFVPVDRTIINLNGGILYDTERELLTELPDVSNNHYGSLIEKKEFDKEYLTIIGFAHHAPPPEIKIINVPCRFAWLKIIHSRNLNSKTSGLPMVSKKAMSHFTVDKNAFAISTQNTILYFLQRMRFKIKQKLIPIRR